MPMSLAACRLSVDISSARRIVSRSTHSTFWRSLKEGMPDVCALAVPPTVMASCEIVEPVVNTTARSMAFSSSRTLPGQ